MHIICLVSIYQANPEQSHDKVVKMIFRYLKGTVDFGLCYRKDDDFSLKVVLIGLDVLMKKEVQVVMDFSWEIDWSLG